MGVPVLVFVLAVAAAVIWGRSAMRWLVVTAIFLAAVRGGLFVLADDAGLSDPTLTVNALVPAIIAAIVVGVVIKLRPKLMEFSKPLLLGWVVIAFVALVNLGVQTVGLRLYGIGLAQYLVYPSLALIVWPLMEEGDARRLTRVIIGVGLMVAFTVMLQAANIESFIQQANAQVDGLAANRYAGITGSYLHTSAFLGSAFVLTLGETIGRRGWRDWAIGTVALAWIFSAVILTFSRSGVMISAIGMVLLFIFAAKDRRVFFAALVLPAIMIAIGIGATGGVTPKAAGERAASGLQTQGDKGNELRSESISTGWQYYKDDTLVHQLLGNGLASTGNARQLDDPGEVLNIVESYYLKILTETGVFGALLIGGFLIWAMFYFLRSLWYFRDPQSASLAAAGIGLGLYNVIYPALETQLLAATWWLIFSISLRYTWERSGEETRFLLPIGGGQEPSGVDALRDPAAHRGTG